MHIATFMSADEVKNTGIDSLSSAQRSALDRWFNRYTNLMISGMASSTVAHADLDYPTSKGHWIDEVSSDGAIIILEDGSVWSVDSADQSDTSVWLSTTDISVAHLTRPVGDYKFLLRNTEDHEKAHAKYLGQK